LARKEQKILEKEIEYLIEVSTSELPTKGDTFHSLLVFQERSMAYLELSRWLGRPNEPRFVQSFSREKLWEKIHKLIEKESLEICLLSPYEYVREYKKWLLNNQR